VTSQTNSREAVRALVKFNAFWLGAVFAVPFSAGLFLATIVLVIKGGDSVDPMLGQLRYFFPGYSVSFSGAFIGALWAAVAGFVLGEVLGRAYGPWVLQSANADNEEDAADPMASIMLLSPLPFALVTGVLLAVGLILATNWLWLTTGEFSPHLYLLHKFLPGFKPTFLGSLAGGASLFVYGFLGAGSVAFIYDRVARMRAGGGRGRGAMKD
jgi:hypothetical protein